MINPFQCVLFCSRLKQGLPSVILAASGSSIYSIGPLDGVLLSTWPRRKSVDEVAKVDLGEKSEAASERPEKRRKLSAGASSESSSADIVVENGAKKKRYRGRSMGASIPAVIKLVGTLSGNHVVAVTGEDKCIRVFDVLDDGSIEQTSERAMPKRPCSIALTTDEKTILCADKFGDVYALPFENLLAAAQSTSGAGQIVETHAVPVEKPFIPAANHFTIHTKTNKRALLNQQNAATKVTEKKVLAFAHQLLLGHVSLLTDLAYVTMPIRDSDCLRSRNYIITADRDEHIRVSRALPQSHVIENYCLGHTSFVSKLCVPKWNTDILVSGGGDNYLLSWDWLAGKIVQKIDIAATLNNYRPVQDTASIASDDKTSPRGASSLSIAVSGLWAIPSPSTDGGSMQGELMVACEGVPVLLIFSLTSNKHIELRDCLHFQGNVLDLSHNPEQGALLVTLDNAHQSWSTDKMREHRGKEFLVLCKYSTEESRWSVAEEEIGASMAVNEWTSNMELSASEEPSQEQSLGNTLYGIGNLRKKGNEEQ